MQVADIHDYRDTKRGLGRIKPALDAFAPEARTVNSLRAGTMYIKISAKGKNRATDHLVTQSKTTRALHREEVSFYLFTSYAE